jgi:TolA-binding protein
MKVDLHPEESLDRERAGELAPDERNRLDEHARQCVACAFERRVTSDFSDLFSPFAGDDAVVARLVENAMNPPRQSRTSLRRQSHPARRPRRLNRVLLIAAALMIGGLAAAAAYSVISKRPRPPPVLVAATPATPSAAPQLGAQSAAPSPPSAVNVPDVEELPDDVPPARASGSPATEPPSPSAAKSQPSANAAGLGDLDAAELFARGNKARRGGSYADAVRHYSELQKRFPGSREAHTSQVALGWLLLNQLGNSSGALAQFNGYLASGGVLSEEASAGRALALGRLGRSGEERQAWQQLLDRYPQSVHAERARQRLQELK